MNLPNLFSIKLLPSRWLNIAIIFVYSLSICVIIFLQTTAVNKWVLFLIVVLSMIWHWRNMYRCTVIQIFPETTEESWVLVKKTAGRVDADLVGSLVYRFLVILYFRLERGGRCVVLIPSDSTDKESHRRLRSLLQMRKLEAGN